MASPQKRRSSRQVKRKRYTEDLEFRISEDDDSGGDDSSAPKSPSSSSQLQDAHEAEGPVVEKIMGLRGTKKRVSGCSFVSAARPEKAPPCANTCTRLLTSCH